METHYRRILEALGPYTIRQCIAVSYQLFERWQSRKLVGLVFWASLSALSALINGVAVVVVIGFARYAPKFSFQLQVDSSSPFLAGILFQLCVSPTEASNTSHWPRIISKTPASLQTLLR